MDKMTQMEHPPEGLSYLWESISDVQVRMFSLIPVTIQMLPKVIGKGKIRRELNLTIL